MGCSKFERSRPLHFDWIYRDDHSCTGVSGALHGVHPDASGAHHDHDVTGPDISGADS
jgi:hypothetical protein